MSNGDQPICPTGSCGYGVEGTSGDCDTRDSSCANARFHIPETSTGFFPDSIRQVALGLNGIFDSLHEDPSGQGRDLSLLRTPRGIAVGYLRHNVKGDPDPKKVRADDPRVIEELRIVDQGDQSNVCGGGRCGFEIVDDEVRCVSSDVASCWPATFLAAEVCNYHPQNVADKMQAIKDLVASLYHEANGRILRLVLTSNGPMLVWATYQPASQTAP